MSVRVRCEGATQERLDPKVTGSMDDTRQHIQIDGDKLPVRRHRLPAIRSHQQSIGACHGGARSASKPIRLTGSIETHFGVNNAD